MGVYCHQQTSQVQADNQITVGQTKEGRSRAKISKKPSYEFNQGKGIVV